MKISYNPHFLSIGAEAIFSPTSISISDQNLYGSVFFHFMLGYHNQTEEATYWDIKLGYQLCFTDLYKYNQTLNRNLFSYNLFIAELGTGFSDDRRTIDIGLFFKFGIGLEGERFASVGARFGINVLDVLMK